jgi:hypothetical protein
VNSALRITANNEVSGKEVFRSENGFENGFPVDFVTHICLSS